MTPPSALSISTSSVKRLIKEEASYHRELEVQEKRLQKIINEDVGDDNQEWYLKQQRTVIEETKAVFPTLKQKMENALQNLEKQLETETSHDDINVEEVNQAKEIIQKAKAILMI